MFGLYRRCGSIKDTISVNGMDNGSSLNTFTNSSNISTIPSSILYNSTHRSETCKIMNVLLLLFLVFGSCGVSFGSDDEKEDEKQQDENKTQESILHAQFIATIQTISKQNEGNGSKQVNNTFYHGANHGIEIIDRPGSKPGDRNHRPTREQTRE